MPGRALVDGEDHGPRRGSAVARSGSAAAWRRRGTRPGGELLALLGARGPGRTPGTSKMRSPRWSRRAVISGSMSNPRALERERAEEVGADRLVAGHEVGDVGVEEDVRGQGHAAVAHHVEERVAGVAVEGAHPEDRVGVPARAAAAAASPGRRRRTRGRRRGSRRSRPARAPSAVRTAAPLPWLASWWWTWTFAGQSRSSMILRVPSVEPSSTTISSWSTAARRRGLADRPFDGRALVVDGHEDGEDRHRSGVYSGPRLNAGRDRRARCPPAGGRGARSRAAVRPVARCSRSSSISATRKPRARRRWSWRSPSRSPPRRGRPREHLRPQGPLPRQRRAHLARRSAGGSPSARRRERRPRRRPPAARRRRSPGRTRAPPHRADQRGKPAGARSQVGVAQEEHGRIRVRARRP